MKAIVLATGKDRVGAIGHQLDVLLPVGDRPFLQHVVDYLVNLGIDEFNFVLSNRPEEVEQSLGDGTRWGSRFHYHLVPDPDHPYKILKLLALDDEPLWLVHADQLPDISHWLPTSGQETPLPRLFYWNPKDEPACWVGWACLDKSLIEALSSSSTREQLEQQLRMLAMDGGEFCQVDQPLDVQSLQGLLRTQSEVLAGARSELRLEGRQVEPGIWLGRDVALDDSAVLQSPVFVGENCQIEAGVKVGPNAAVGGHCIIGKETTLENTVVLPRTCVGEELSLKDSMVDGNRLANIGFDMAIEVGDELLLSSIDGLSLGDILARTLGRLGALVLLVLTWPLLVLATCWMGLTRRGPVWQSREVLRLPAFSDEAAWDTCRLWRLAPDPILERDSAGEKPNYWRHFIFNFLPGLLSVVRGDLTLIGVSPRDRQEVKKLNADWQELYLKSRSGLLCEAHLWGGDWDEEEEFYAADACYAVCAGTKVDIKLLACYFARLFWPFANWGGKNEIEPWADPFVPNAIPWGGLNNYKAVDRE